jgi:hypothetical protein
VTCDEDLRPLQDAQGACDVRWHALRNLYLAPEDPMKKRIRFVVPVVVEVDYDDAEVARPQTDEVSNAVWTVLGRFDDDMNRRVTVSMPSGLQVAKVRVFTAIDKGAQ